MIASIWAQASNGVIGKGGTIPWRYSGDFKRFKRVTLGSTIVMGRKTYESIGKPLPGRENIVISGSFVQTGRSIDGVRVVDSLSTFLFFGEHRKDVWIIGGAQVYADAMPYVDIVDVTYVPDEIDLDNAVVAPVIDETIFSPGEMYPHEDEPALKRRVFVRRTLAEAPYDDASNRRLQELGYLSRRTA